MHERDLVVADSTDCSAAERASGTLYTDDFLGAVAALVRPGGFFVRNYTSLLWNLDEAKNTLPRYRAHFPYCAPFSWAQPTYSSGSYSALLCGAAPPAARDLGAASAALGEMQYWTPAVHHAAFALPAAVERAINEPQS